MEGNFVALALDDLRQGGGEQPRLRPLASTLAARTVFP